MRTILFALAIAAAPASADRKLDPKAEPQPPPRVREIAHRLFEEAVQATADGNARSRHTTSHCSRVDGSRPTT